MNKKGLLVLAGVVALTLSGCSFSFHTSTQTINTSAGDFRISLTGEEDRTIVERDDGDFDIVDESDDAVANLIFYDASMEEHESDIVNGVYEKVTINKREYYHGDTGEPLEDFVSSNFYMSWLGDVGCDSVQIVFADEDEMNYIKYAGKALKDETDPLEDMYDFNLSGEKPESTTAEETEEGTTEEAESVASDAVSELEFPNGITVTVKGYNLVENREDTVVSGLEGQRSYDDIETKTNFLIVYSSVTDSKLIPQFLSVMDNFKEYDYEEEANTSYATLSVRDDESGAMCLYHTAAEDGEYFVVISSSKNVDLLTTIHDINDQIYEQDDTIKSQQDFRFSDLMLGATYETEGETERETERETEEETERETSSLFETSESFEAAGDKYWKDPTGWEKVYDCEYFTEYENDEYDVTWWYDPDNYVTEYLTDKSEDFIYAEEGDVVDTYDIKALGETWHVIFHKSIDDDYTFNYYYLVSDDGAKYVEVEGDSPTAELANAELTGIIEVFLQ